MERPSTSITASHPCRAISKNWFQGIVLFLYYSYPASCFGANQFNSQCYGSNNWGMIVRYVLTVCPRLQYQFMGYASSSSVNGGCQDWYAIDTAAGQKVPISNAGYTTMSGVWTALVEVTSAPLEFWTSCVASGASNKDFFDDIALTFV